MILYLKKLRNLSNSKQNRKKRSHNRSFKKAGQKARFNVCFVLEC